MSSIIEGYNYDIFISYRQNDNKYDGWVTEFVTNLNKELEATIKDKVTVYFDANPHDGLLETHSVDRSLEDKLKCLIFIPILSRTYCDPNSYAWNKEFLAFLESAQKDSIGLNIKLGSGNVASRVLLIRIHDLNPEDITLVESQLGVIRSIDFIYKEPGVNRPLRSNEDHPNDNLNRTYYRNQINKVANSIDEIIRGLKRGQTIPTEKRLLYDQSSTNLQAVATSKETGPIIVTKKLKRWLTAGLLIILFFTGVFGLFSIIESNKKSNVIAKLEKSIAVLPFVNDSPDQENTYFINGIMDEILNNLQKIKDFRVLSRTSVEKYRGQTKLSVPEIAKELNVNYIVEGSGQKYGNKFVLRVQLIAATNEKHLWGESFERDIIGINDIINLQSQIAQAIASELKATITPMEKQLMEIIPTTNLTAYDFVLRGDEEALKFWNDNDKQALERAAEMYNKALKIDSTCALAYTGLAGVYIGKHGDASYFSENYLDSTLILANRALAYDDHLAQAYFLRGDYYLCNMNLEMAIKDYEKAIKFDPNIDIAYLHLGYAYSSIDYLKALEAVYGAVKVSHGSERAGFLRYLGLWCGEIGFPEEAKSCCEEALMLGLDTSLYFNTLGQLECCSGNYEKANELMLKSYARDTDKFDYIGWLAFSYCTLGQYKESLKYLRKIEKQLESIIGFNSEVPFVGFIGYVYLMNGYIKEADHWFDILKKSCEISLKRSNIIGNGAYYGLAAYYAIKGNKSKTYKNLAEFSKSKIFHLGTLTDIKTAPCFNIIKNEPEFQKIVSEMESKYQAEHERVRKWLEEQGKL